MRIIASVSMALLIVSAVFPSCGSARSECTEYAEQLFHVPGVNTPDYAYDVAVSGTYAFVADGLSGLQVVDLSDPVSPSIVGHLGTPGSADAVAASGTLAYVADRDYGLRIVDVSDPTAPHQVGYVSAPDILTVAVDGTMVYITVHPSAAPSALWVIDASSPALPQVLGSVSTGGWGTGLAAVGGIACLADQSALRVIDVSIPTSPLLVGSLSMHAVDVGLDGDTAYVACGDAGLCVVDLSNPSLPQTIGGSALPCCAIGVALLGGRAFVADHENGLYEVDISDPTAPFPVRVIPTLGVARGVAFAGAYACVAAGSTGLRVVDTLNPPPQVPFVPLPGGAGTITTRGSLAYVVGGDLSMFVGGFYVVDISDPAVPVLIGGTPGGFIPTSVAVSGAYAYVGVFNDGPANLCVVDISDSAHPTSVGCVPVIHHQIGPLWGLAARGNYLYAAAYETGLVIFDISNPTTPIVAAILDMPSEAVGIGIEGEHAFVLCETGLMVFDLVNPVSPHLVATLDTPGDAHSMLVDAGTAFVLGSLGFDVIDLSSPLSPQWVGGLQGIPWCRNVGRSGSFVYLTCPSEGILVLNVAQPTAPILIGSTNALQEPYAIAATLDAVCVADDSGLRVLPVQCSGSSSAGVIDPGLAFEVIPNPARGESEVRFFMDGASSVRLDLFDSAGRLVRRILDRPLAPGRQAIAWRATDDDGRALPAGVYQVRLQAGAVTRIGKAIVVR